MEKTSIDWRNAIFPARSGEPSYFTFEDLQVLGVLRRQISGGAKLGGFLHQGHCLSQDVEALLRRDAREEADSQRSAVRPGYRRMSFQGNAQRGDLNPVVRDAEILGHECGIVGADRDEAVDVRKVRADELQALAPPRLFQALQEEIFALQRARYGPI